MLGPCSWFEKGGGGKDVGAGGNAYPGATNRVADASVAWSVLKGCDRAVVPKKIPLVSPRGTGLLR